jgi:uncharacterized protein YfaS (alpha-2-macroglobulin family)/tetratricopeptide (TPR) repeat protein
MRLLASLLALLTWFPLAAPQITSSAGGYDALRTQAEAQYAEKSFGLAHGVYERLAQLDLTPEQRRWVRFRLEDTAWRSDSAAPNPDPTVREQARQGLEALLREAGADHDRLWAEVNESLGDYHTMDDRYVNPYSAQQYYLAALDWWAGSDDLALARRRYLDLVWRMVRGYRNYGGEENASNIPREVLVNAERIAESQDEKAHARYLLAIQMLNQGRPADVERGIELLELLIRDQKSTPWYDDALFQLAERYASNGSVIVLDDGRTQYRPEFVKALELYRRLLAEAGRNSRYADEARDAIEEITEATVNVITGSTFLPGSEQEVVLSWRNVKSVQLTLTSVDLPRDAMPEGEGEQLESNWLDAMRTAGGTVVRRWKYETNDRGDYAPGNHHLRITPALPPGAYLLTAAAGAETSRTLVLVTDAHILVHAAGDSLHAFLSDVITGQPIAGANVAVRYVKNQKTVGRTGQTDADGVARFELPDTYGSVMVAASKGMARQAYHQTYTQHYGRTPDGEWRIYAFTDRPAYRPEETVQWKIVARTRKDERWSTPAGAAITYEISDPRGQKVSSGTATLNAFGSFWGELPLTKEMALGVYTVRFRGSNNGDIGGAQFFRLEEYKLPEFRVSVTTPPGKQYRLGETIDATIEATYYFGGPVANATVEAVIYQEPFYRMWTPWRTYDWYYPPDQRYRPRQELRRETIKTDAEGRAVVHIETQRDGSEMAYRIEARVVDASRREVVGSGEVRVLRQRYTVLARTRHYVGAPNVATTVDFKAMDANERPVQVTGTVRVVRRTLHPKSHFLDPQDDVEVLTTKLTTDADGDAALTFTPPRTGYYVITWTSMDSAERQPVRARDLVSATTMLWVTDSSSVDIGYLAPGLQVIFDREAVRSGERVPVLVAAPTSGRWVVLSSSATSILETRVLHLEGTVKLIELTLDERHVPNFFLTASSVYDRTIDTQTLRIVVPPVEQFLDVQVKADRSDYEPRQQGTLTITTRDASGKPVPSEVAISVSDEAVTAIEQDLAGDPRMFFYGESVAQTMGVSGSVHSQQYVKLVELKSGKLVDERYEKQAREEEAKRERDGTYTIDGVNVSQTGGVVGGVVGAPPPPPMVAPSAVSESITVTAAAATRQSRLEKVADQALNYAGPAQEPAAVTVRSDFRSTAFWKPDVVTGSDGTATVTFKYPEALTTWRATARAITTGAQVGSATTTAQTNMPLMVRLQAPRFFVAGDRATVSAVINNNTDAAMTVTPAIELEGTSLKADGAHVAPLTVPAHGEARADWTVLATQAGEAKVRVTGRASARADAMERTFRVYEHGIDKLVARSGRLRADEALIRLDLPRDRRATDLTVYLAPSLAGAMIDALPYLIEFPYGCTEQTMSRFLPAAVVARTLREQGIDVSKRPEFRNLDAVTKASMARLYDFQHPNGGWGWWKESGDDAFMTAYVVWGFAIAKSAGLAVNDAAINRAVSWLEHELPRAEGQPHDQAWILHATTAWHAAAKTKASSVERAAFDDAYKNREHLSAYSRALLALSARRLDDSERAHVLVRNLQDGVAVDRRPDQSVLIRNTSGAAPETMATAHWGAADRFWWRWWEGPVETTAFVLQALLTIEPENALVEPAMNWLVKNRRGARWSNTRDTAISILTLNEVLRTERGAPATSYEVAVNGTVVAAKPITAADFLRGPIRVPVDAALVKESNEIRIRRGGGGSLYFSTEARFVSLEEPVTAAGNELFVRRDYYRIVPHPTLLKGVVYEKVPLRDGESVPSNERVEVVVTVESKNDYEYLLFEDLKPAGLEAVALQSGTPLAAVELRAASVLRVQPKPTEVRRGAYADQTGRSVAVYQELRDRNVALFIDKLPQGTWEIRYTLRAEVPGQYHALPLLGQAMYVPDIRANGEEIRIGVE